MTLEAPSAQLLFHGAVIVLIALLASISHGWSFRHGHSIKLPLFT